MNRLSGWRDQVRGSLWAVPGLCVALAVAAALVLVEVDRSGRAGRPPFTFGAGADGAREVLGAITSAMITFTGLVFSITVVVLQLTSSQFSPRVLRTFLRDRLTQWSLGVFSATFVYAVMVLRTVRSEDATGDTFVPALSTTLAVALLLLSVGLFVAYIHHIGTAIQVSSIIAAIGQETRDAIDRRYPPDRVEPVDDPVPQAPVALPSTQVPAPRAGVVVAVDERALVGLACRAGVVLRTRAPFGAFVPEGAPLLEVLGDAGALDVAAVTGAVVLGRDRTLQQDVAFGFRQLVDIADRSLSPSTNDPTTAVQSLDQLHDLLRRLATRPLRTGVHTDDEGHPRLLLPPERLADFLALALDEVEQYGRDHRPVQQRIDDLLDDVLSAARPEHRAALEQRQARRRQAAGR